MRIAIIGSRDSVPKNLSAYLSNCDEIVSGGARGVDAHAAEYAVKNKLRLKEFCRNMSVMAEQHLSSGTNELNYHKRTL